MMHCALPKDTQECEHGVFNVWIVHCAALNDTQEWRAQMLHCVQSKDTQECGAWSTQHYMECEVTHCCETTSVLRTNEVNLELW